MILLRALWNLLDARQRRQLLGLQLLSVVMALCTVGGIASVVPFFAALADPGALRHAAIARSVLSVWTLDDRSFVVLLGTAFAASVLLANLVNLFGQLLINRFAARVGDTLYVRLFREYMHRQYEFHVRNSGSELAGRVQEGARVASGLIQHALMLVTSLVTIVFVAAAIIYINPLVAFVALMGLGSSYALIYMRARRQLLRNGQSESRHHMERMKTVKEGLGAIREVILMRAHAHFIDRFARQSRSLSSAAVNSLTISQAPKYILECLTVMTLVGVALYLSSGASGQGVWMAQLTCVAFAAYRLLPALQQAFAAVVKLRTDRTAFAGIEMDLASGASGLHVPASGATQVVWPGRPNREIRLCDVSFSYSPERPAAVRAVSLIIPKGCVVGFIGANGSGKTTLLDLVSGLLVPQSGHLEIDGVRLTAADRDAWQANIAYVPQHSFLLEATLAENIAFGVPPGQIDRARLESVARMAQLQDFVGSLPAGYETRLGDGGQGLSGGQRQRVAIARALYRDVPVLILDEATSALDPESEAEMAATLNGLRGRRTLLINAHRRGALRHCDLVFELEAGALVDSGSVAKLLAPVRVPDASREILAAVQSLRS